MAVPPSPSHSTDGELKPEWGIGVPPVLGCVNWAGGTASNFQLVLGARMTHQLHSASPTVSAETWSRWPHLSEPSPAFVTWNGSFLSMRSLKRVTEPTHDQLWPFPGIWQQALFPLDCRGYSLGPGAKPGLKIDAHLTFAHTFLSE